jgi:spermidine synthase
MTNTMAKMPRYLPILLAFCMFSTGGSGLVNEYVLATVTTYILGNSIEQFSLIIACMMLMMGVSGFVQEKMSDDFLVEKFIKLEITMAIVGGFAPLLIYAAFGFFEDSFLFIHYGIVLLIGFLIGFEIPLVMRILEKQDIGLKYNLKLVYGMDYIGAFIGAIIWVKFLLVNFPLTEISFIVAGTNFIVAAITIIYFLFTGFVKATKTIIFGLISTTTLLCAGYSYNIDMSNLLEQKFYEDPISYQKTTKYQHLVLTHNKNTDDVRLYINGNTQFSSIDEDRYHDFLVHPAMSVAPRIDNVLILGGGDGLALREVLKYKGVKSVTLVDLDPGMVEMSRTVDIMRKLNKDSLLDARVHLEMPNLIDTGEKELVILSDKDNISQNKDFETVAEVDVYNVDADKFIKAPLNMKWDVVIIDFPDPSSIELSKLYTVQFYKALKRNISDDTFISIQSTSPFHAKESYLAIGATMRAAGLNVIPYHQNIPSFGDWGYYIAWKGKYKESNIQNYLSNLSGFKVETDFITPQGLSASFAFGKGELTAKSKCVNTLMRPCLLNKYNHESWIIE